jgi:hypothetical protein
MNMMGKCSKIAEISKKNNLKEGVRRVLATACPDRREPSDSL